MDDALFDPSVLSVPGSLRRRHLALMLVDECMGGRESRTLCFLRRSAAGGGELLSYESGSGDEYGLVVEDDDALLWVFDHECPYSPWGHDDEPQDWPGMLDGLPERLATHLPEVHGDSPRSISGCYWHADGGWRRGDPEPAADDPGPFLSDPQGARWLLGPLLDAAGEGVSGLVVEYYERPDRAGAAAELVAHVDAGEPVSERELEALAPHDGVATMLARAKELGLA